MAGGGAAAAAIIAAKAARTQAVIDAFRLGDATSPERARRIEELGVAHNAEADELISSQVLLPGRREGTYYLSEAGYIAHRESRKNASAITIVAVVVIVAALAIIFRMTTRT